MRSHIQDAVTALSGPTAKASYECEKVVKKKEGGINCTGS